MKKFTDKEVEAQADIIASATSKPSDGYALQLRLDMESGKFAETRQAVQSVLENGNASPDMQRLAADIIKQLSKREKRTTSPAPKGWWKIGSAVNDLRKAGLSYQEAVAEYSMQEGIGETKVDQAAGFYNHVKRMLGLPTPHKRRIVRGDLTEPT